MPACVIYSKVRQDVCQAVKYTGFFRKSHCISDRSVFLPFLTAYAIMTNKAVSVETGPGSMAA